jgi:hypothetical protein
MREVLLVNTDLTAKIDDEDYDLVSLLEWRLQGNDGDEQYAWSRRTGLFMHHVVMLDLRRHDHKDGNGLNNQKSNLRVCTSQQNSANSKKRSAPTTSRFKGVWRRPSGTWSAHIRVFGVKHHLGTFQDEIDAAIAYDEAASRAFGEFAQLNLSCR